MESEHAGWCLPVTRREAPPVAPSGRKGGAYRAGDGPPPPNEELLVPVPRGLFLRMNAETALVMFYLIFLLWRAGRPGSWFRLREIAEGAGLSQEKTRLILIALKLQHWVEEDRRGWRLASFVAEDFEPDES